MKYIIYKTTNLQNGKIYIGKHKTTNINDDYLGSGKILKRAIDKYGESSFHKDILFIYDNEIDMNNKECELVNEDFVNDNNTYNICIGGKGGFSYINNNGYGMTSEKRQSFNNNETRKKISDGVIDAYKSGKLVSCFKQRHIDNLVKYDTFTGRNHSDETKLKMSNMKKGKNTGTSNSQFGTIWIVNITTEESKKVKNGKIPEGWKKGRKL